MRNAKLRLYTELASFQYSYTKVPIKYAHIVLANAGLAIIHQAGLIDDDEIVNSLRARCNIKNDQQWQNLVDCVKELEVMPLYPEKIFTIQEYILESTLIVINLYIESEKK